MSADDQGLRQSKLGFNTCRSQIIRLSHYYRPVFEDSSCVKTKTFWDYLDYTYIPRPRDWSMASVLFGTGFNCLITFFV